MTSSASNVYGTPSRAAHDGIEVLRAERPEAGVNVARMVQDDHALGGARADRLHQIGPVFGPRVGDGRARLKWKGVEVSPGSRHLIADHGRELGLEPQPSHQFAVIREMVMIGGDRQLDSFPREGDQALFYRRVAVATIRERMHVCIASDQARRGDFAADRQRERQFLARAQDHGARCQAVLEARYAA